MNKETTLKVLKTKIQSMKQKAAQLMKKRATAPTV